MLTDISLFKKGQTVYAYCLGDTIEEWNVISVGKKCVTAVPKYDSTYKHKLKKPIKFHAENGFRYQTVDKNGGFISVSLFPTKEDILNVITIANFEYDLPIMSIDIPLDELSYGEVKNLADAIRLLQKYAEYNDE